MSARFKFVIEYRGAGFVGWQRQANGLSVQETLETALAEVDGGARAVQGAGRTDSGVHALGQVAHADLEKPWRPDRLRDALNARMRPHPVCVLSVEPVSESFSARFSALRRHYVYRILDRRAPPCIEAGLVWHVPRRLDDGAMAEAARRMLGRHDFTTFRAAECQATSPVRTLETCSVARLGDVLEVRASARSFLHHQVRSMVGSLKYVGAGKWTPDDLAAALAARDRSRCGVVAPPQGLFFERVDY